MSEEKEKNIKNKSQNKEKEELFETAYEKVLYIINKVKDFIKTISKNENKLIEELDWVIKIITNRSLYTYELVKEKMLKQKVWYLSFQVNSVSLITGMKSPILSMRSELH